MTAPNASTPQFSFAADVKPVLLLVKEGGKTARLVIPNGTIESVVNAINASFGSKPENWKQFQRAPRKTKKSK